VTVSPACRAALTWPSGNADESGLLIQESHNISLCLGFEELLMMGILPSRSVCRPRSKPFV
jgi:hypothetical protein